MRRLISYVGKFFLRCMVVLLIATCTVVITLRWINPPVSTYMLLTAGSNSLTTPKWVDWDRISPWLPMAIMAAEDQRFPDHWGFDTRQIKKALEDRVRGKRLRGASTITQQLAKNLFLWPQRSWFRKTIEAYFTLLLETFLSKQRILELYMNVVEFGPRLFGAEIAAEDYYGKSAERLSLNESCRLAAVLPNPRVYNPLLPDKPLLRKIRWIEDQVKVMGAKNYLARL